MRRLLVTPGAGCWVASCARARPEGEEGDGLIGARVLATGVDYVVAVTPLALIGLGSLAAGRLRARRSAGASGPEDAGVLPRLVVAALVEVPVAVALGLADASGGTPGRRLAGLVVVRPDGSRAGRGRCLVRSMLKVAFPWHLGHQAVWDLAGTHERRGTAFSVAAHVLVVTQAVQLVRSRQGRTYADVLAGTMVVRDTSPAVRTDKE